MNKKIYIAPEAIIEEYDIECDLLAGTQVQTKKASKDSEAEVHAVTFSGQGTGSDMGKKGNTWGFTGFEDDEYEEE